jgi:hypothetical protein
MKSSANMPRVAPSPSIWSFVKGPLSARLATFVLIVLIGTLLLAASAHAAAAGAEPPGEASSQAPVVESATEVSSPAPAEPAEPAPEVSSPAPAEPAEPAPEVSSPAPAEPAEPAPEVSSPAPAEPAEPAPEVSSPAPAEPAEPAPEASSPAEPVVEQVQEVSSPVAPVVEQVQEVLSPATPVVEHVQEVLSPATPVVEPTPEALSPAGSSKEVVEASAGKPTLEHGAESPLSAGSSPPGSALPEVSGAAAGSVTTALPSTPEELSTAWAPSSAYAAALARKGVVQRAVAFARELAGLGASPMYTQTVGLEVHSLISVALVEDLAMGKAGRARVRAGGGSGSSPGGSGPISPQPGPAPGGAFGGAAGGGSGIALSGFPTFAGHLLMGAPLAMRRLRLSFQPWLTAFFVLIPERPG